MMKIARIQLYILSLSIFFLFAMPVFASVNFNLNGSNDKTSGAIMDQVNSAGEKAGLTNEDPGIYIAELIPVVLSVIGTLFVVLMVYAGYVRVTAQGEDDRIQKSNNTAIAAIIGLSIVILAYGITVFITARIYNATTYEPAYEEKNSAPGTIIEKSINLKLN